MYDMNDAELPRNSELIPDGSFAKVSMAIRPGNVDGQGEHDRGLLKGPKTPGSDALMLDCEFTVMAGPHARRKFWQNFTVAGGKVDEHGVSIGWKISKGTFRAMIDSALGLNSEDMSEATKAKRVLRGLSDLDGISFVAKIKIEPPTDPRYSASNRLDRVVLATEPEWQKIMNGETVPAQPSQTPARAAAKPAPATTAPAWATPAAPSTGAATAARPAWERPAAATVVPTAPPPAASPSAGPSWLNG